MKIIAEKATDAHEAFTRHSSYLCTRSGKYSRRIDTIFNVNPQREVEPFDQKMAANHFQWDAHIHRASFAI